VTPDFYVFVGGIDMTANFRSILLDLCVESHEGTDSDSVSITVDDRNGEVMLPSRGDIIAVGMGYKETGVFPMGLFTVDEVTAMGWPRQVHIRGRALEMEDKFKEHRNGGYENKTVQQIVSEIAGRHGLVPVVLGSVGSFKYNYRAQNQSDMDFLTNLGYEHDAIAKVANGALLFWKKGEMFTGIVEAICPGNVKSYEMRMQDRPKHDKARGHHWDRKKGKYVRQEEKSGSYGDPSPQ
jgi:phage protein D